MARSSVKRVLDLASDLSEEERAEVATELLGGLGYPGEEVTADAWERAWGAEIARRVEKMRQGERGVPWPQVRERIRAKLAGTSSKRRG